MTALVQLLLKLLKRPEMNFQPIQVELKNNKTVTIRQSVPDDAEQLMETVKTYLADSEFIPKDADEFRLTLQDEIDWIRSFLEKPNSLLLVAEHAGRIVGNIDLTGSPRKAMQHTAVIGMGMLAPWRNCGLGTALMSAAIDWAQENELLELLWLQVYTENQAGIALYRKFGFREKGIIEHFFRTNGKYSDVLTMSLSLKF